MTANILNLDPGEKGVVGSMVVENTNDSEIQLSVEGDGPVLRGKYVIKVEDAVTPCLKIYYSVMNMYLDPSSFEEAKKPFLDLARELVAHVPSTGVIMADIGENIINGDFRSAFESCFLLLQYEEQLEKAAAEKAANTD